MGDNLTIYRRYPWSGESWVDITANLSVMDIDIESRVNGAGIATIKLGEAQRYAERALNPGYHFKIFHKSPDGNDFDRPDFEGYIPPDYMPFIVGIESQIDLPIVGYYDIYGRTQNRHNHLQGMHVVSAMDLLHKQVLKPDGTNFMDFAAECQFTELVPDNFKHVSDIKIAMEALRMLMVDETNPLFPRFYHFVTVPTSTGSPILTLRKEPDITGTPHFTINSEDVLRVVGDTTNKFLTSVIIGEENGWSRRYGHQNFRDKFFTIDRDIRSKDDYGLDASYKKTYELLRGRDLGKTLTVTLTNRQQIPLLSLIDFDSDEEELQGNHIVYGVRENRTTTLRTELILRNLPDVKV
jgi:hypothetical protein